MSESYKHYYFTITTYSFHYAQINTAYAIEK